MKTLTKHTVLTLNKYWPDRYALDPSLGAVELESRIAEAARIERSANRNGTWARVMFYGGCVLGVIAVALGVNIGEQVGAPVGIAAGLIGVVGGLTFSFRGDAVASRHFRLVKDWADAGDAIDESLTDDMVVSPDTSDEDIFRALQLLRRAKTGYGRVRWAKSLRIDDTLASSAHPLLDQVEALPGELRQQAADILDPSAERTKARLDEAGW